MKEKFVKQFLEKADIQLNGHRSHDFRVVDRRFYQISNFLDPSLSIGEAYVNGWWECEQLDEFFFRIFRTYENVKLYSFFAKLYSYLKNTVYNLQNFKRSQKVVKEHYNLGNDLYAAMLGKSMAYTCAYWKDAKQLDEAQYAKFDLICRKLKLTSGEKVLELGCGWGSLAKFMATEYECSVVAVNLSSEQVHYARQICTGLPVNIYLTDYRHIHQYNPASIKFDKVVSVGLCEHVGPHNYQRLMHIAKTNLKENGLFLLHTIAKNNSDFYIDPWINKYVFPNGMLPSLAQLSRAAENRFIIEDVHNFGADYDKTLMAWQQNFVQNWPLLSSTYGPHFYRQWNYYLLSCAGSFRARNMQLLQLMLTPKGEVGGYVSIR